jgi:hypothetical protein
MTVTFLSPPWERIKVRGIIMVSTSPSPGLSHQGRGDNGWSPIVIPGLARNPAPTSVIPNLIGNPVVLGKGEEVIASPSTERRGNLHDGLNPVVEIAASSFTGEGFLAMTKRLIIVS